LILDLLELVELRAILGDGGMGTMLQEHGLAVGDCPEALNLDRPGLITQVHSAYRDAGCDFIETNTFGANPIKLGRYGLDSRTDEVVKAGVDLARSAAGETCMVAGSVGPTGALLKPYGECPRDQVADAFRQTARAMEQAGVDFFVVETMSDPDEAILAIGAIKEISKRPVVATMSFSKGTKGYRTMMGTSPQEAATRLTDAGADIVGTNCCIGPAEALDIMTEMREVASRAMIAQPNAGLPTVEGGKTVYPETPQTIAGGMEKLLGAGIRILGGCCGTTPAHMKAIALFMGKG
jgi:5-methyltetrahydrofolate--homocysteine methyltransferase